MAVRRMIKPKAEPKQDYSDVSIEDVTTQIYPEGVPMKEDGSPEAATEISIGDVKKVGALDLESASMNKRTARTMKMRANGEKHVQWGETDSLAMFAQIKEVYPACLIFITRQDPPPCQADPVPLGMFKDPAEFYEHILRNVHKARAQATYIIQFKEGSSQRGQAYLRMPDTTSDPRVAPPSPAFGTPYAQPNPHGMPAMNYPPTGPQFAQGFMQPQPQQQQPYYPPQQVYAPPAPPTAVQAPPPPPPAPAPVVQAAPPTPPQPPAFQFDPYTGQPVGPPAAPQPQFDPYTGQPLARAQAPAPPQDDIRILGGAVASMYQEQQRSQQMMAQSQLQLERTLGMLEEMKRREATPQPPPAPPPWYQPNPQPPQALGAPPGVAPAGYPGYPPAPQAPQAPPPPPQQVSPYYVPLPQPIPPPPPGYGWAPGYGPQAQAAPPPQPHDAIAEVARLGSTFTSLTRAVNSVRNAVNGMPQGFSGGEEEEALAVPIPEPSVAPFQTMPLGPGPNPAVLAYTKEGNIHGVGTALANMPKIVDFLKGIGEQVGQLRQHQQDELLRRGGHLASVQNGQVVEQRALPQNGTPQQPAPINPPTANGSFSPSMASIQRALGGQGG